MSLPVMFHLLRERLSWRGLPRVPEPELVMQDQAQVEAFMEAGNERGVLAFLYFYNAVQITSLLQPGDRVLDLACGPANQLAQMARLNPDVRFVGLDASTTMLDRARTTVTRLGVHNVELTMGDMARLDGIEDASMDCVVCTMSLHHLPDQNALFRTMTEVRRVLKRDGRVYLVDFGRLKSIGTQQFFAEDLKQSSQFTQDYLNSMRAAFSVDELSRVASVLGLGVARYATALAPFTVVFKSTNGGRLTSAKQLLAQALFEELSPQQQGMFQGFAIWFRAGGLGLPCQAMRAPSVGHGARI